MDLNNIKVNKMEHIKLFEEFSEKNNLNTLVTKISKEIDTNKLANLLKPYRDVIRKSSMKYMTNGKIDARLIEKDIRRFTLSKNEGVIDVIARILSKIINLPIKLINGLVNLFSELFSDFQKGATVVIAAILIVVFSLTVYDAVEHSMNGIGIGIVSEIEFIPEHEETQTHYYTDSNGEEQSYTTTETIPDTWESEVRGKNGRIEVWKTTNPNVGKNTKDEDVIRIENWDWNHTKKYGEKSGGGFSGGGAGEKF